MKLLLGLFSLAVVPTILFIIGVRKGRGVREDIAFPSETKMVKVKTAKDFLSGCVAATGYGSFIITKSDKT
jgi:hypothetical protein